MPTELIMNKQNIFQKKMNFEKYSNNITIIKTLNNNDQIKSYSCFHVNNIQINRCLHGKVAYLQFNINGCYVTLDLQRPNNTNSY